MLLAVTEDRATLRSDPSAVAGFSGESDAGRVTLFSLLSKTPLSPENHKCVKPRVRAEPDAPQAPCYSEIPLRLRIDSLQSMTME